MRMATKLRHPQVAPLRTINSQGSFFSKTNAIAKRKSAVQILQETKAFYVKSETVLDKKQEFRPGKVSVSESPYRNFPPNENQKENKLEHKLRVLLDFDSFEGSDPRKEVGRESKICDEGNLGKSTCFQHKSLPDLSMPHDDFSSDSNDSSFDMKCDGDSRSAYSSRTQPETRRSFAEKCVDCRRSTRSSKNFCSPEFRNRPGIYCSFRASKSREFMESKLIESGSSHRRRSSNTSSCNRSRHNSSSKHSQVFAQSADSGRQSQIGSVGLRTGRSGLPEFSSPPPSSSWTDSGTEDDSPPILRVDPGEGDKRRPILRSKSDISYKYCASKPKMASTLVAHPSLPTTEKLETFFDHLGMDPLDYKELASSSRNSSPVFFSSVSSIDSCVDLTGWTLPEPCKVTECPSIVERNARIVKWLYNCRKFQKTVFNEARVTQLSKTKTESVKPLTGKFYARHDFTDPNLIDPDLEQTILRKKMALPKDKFKEPLTGNMEYGWYVRPRVMRARFNYYFPKRSSYITQVGALIAAEDEKIPKKPFTGIAFKV